MEAVSATVAQRFFRQSRLVDSIRWSELKIQSNNTVLTDRCKANRIHYLTDCNLQYESHSSNGIALDRLYLDFIYNEIFNTKHL